MYWKDISNNHEFKDGSSVIQRHPIHEEECIKLYYDKTKTITVSKDHLFLVNISKLPFKAKREIRKLKGEIPRRENIYIEPLNYFSNEELHILDKWLYTGECEYKIEDLSEKHFECYSIHLPSSEKQFFIKRETLETDPIRKDKNHYWLKAEHIATLMDKYRVRVAEFFNYEYAGKLPCFCVSTDSGKYELNGLTHHNSVTIFSIVHHSIQHNNACKICICDIKRVDFEQYKNINGVLAVGNTVEECCEILRICRVIMYKRNAEMQKLGFTNLKKYKPKDKTDRVWITGREYNENDRIKVRIDGEEKVMTAKEVYKITHEASN